MSPARPEARRHLTVLDARPQPPPRGSRVLSALERPFLAVERWTGRVLPSELNPLAQTGAIANVSFAIAVVSGVLLLFWYVPSVHQAYASVAALDDAPYGAGLVRSIHRYSSDACMLFVVLHAIRYTVAGRFGGPRWLAWVTGISAVLILWLVGWLGYWLVWDERAQLVATGTARTLDVIPIFAEPVTRSFLVDDTVSSLLFFVVFFAHMMIPLAAVIFLWLHITRLSRPRFLTNRTLTLWVLGATLAVSLAWPATAAEPAAMLDKPEGFTMDWWYLAPLVLTDRLEGGLLWAFTLGVGALVVAVPWWATRGRARAAEVDVPRCNACEQCVADCPYGAITMVPRTDGRRHATEARVDPAKCVGCGICAGSCNSAGIGLPQLSVREVRENMDRWLEAAVARESRPRVAFLCADSAGAHVSIDPETGRSPELPGTLVWAVPCAGWVHALTVERALRHGAERVVVVACGPGACQFREGTLWTELRMAGEREPELRHAKVPGDRVHVLRLDRGQHRRLPGLLRALDDDVAESASARLLGAASPSRTRRVAAGVALATVFAAATAIASDVPYATPPREGSELVVSFVHAGAGGQRCRKLTEAEKAELPVHMRRDEVCERGRADVRLRIRVDGETQVHRTLEPGGLFGDAASVAMAATPTTAGAHLVEVAIGETDDAEEWTYRFEEEVTFEGEGKRRVLLFDRSRGFELH